MTVIVKVRGKASKSVSSKNRGPEDGKEVKPNFENFEKGRPKKTRWSKPEGGKTFLEGNGNPTFHVEFRDRKGQKWGTLPPLGHIL